MRQKKFNEVLQFKITLGAIDPPVWRRIQVPNYYSFWDLHVAIQDAMGWLDCHLHRFEVFFPKTKVMHKIGIPLSEETGFDDEDLLTGWEEIVAKCFQDREPRISYLYDFGDDWKHAVEFEGLHPRDPGKKYPACLDGARSCPPEDCGGPYGYAETLKIIADKNREEHEEMLEWLGAKFDPERFDPRKVAFDNPATRWRKAFAR